MLASHLLRHLGYRSCSTFSSVLTLGKKSQHADVKSGQSDQLYEQAANSLPNDDLKESYQQIKQASFARSSQGWGARLLNSAQEKVQDEYNYMSNAKKPKRSKRNKRNIGMGWENQGDLDRVTEDLLIHSSQSKYSKRNWDEEYSEEKNPKNTRWVRPKHKPAREAHATDTHWDQSLRFPQHGKLTPEPDQSPFPAQRPSDKSDDKPRGKRLRKKEKLGFIEMEPALSSPDAEQLLYGLHPVSLALSSGRRRVLRVYHRADPADGRLARLLAECAARGVPSAPLPAAQLDRIAGGTGVHQGVCARVSPLLPRTIDELLAEAGYPTLVGGQSSAIGAEETETATDNESGFWSTEEDVIGSEGDGETGIGSEGDGETGNSNGADRRSPPVSTKSEAEVSQAAQRLSGKAAEDSEKRTEVSPDGTGTAVSERPDISSQRRRVWLMLDRVQDPMNFGSIIRSSYFLGVDAVIIPDRNSCPLSPTVSKASAGALEVFPVYSVPADSCRRLLQLLAGCRWQLLAAGSAGDGAGEPAGAISEEADTLLIVGNEGRGVDPALAALCRPWTVPPRRPLTEGVESLNVGVATGILLSRLVLGR